jgi:hypothetical protein
MPDGVTDRDADVWESLLAVADAAGGDWPERARVAAVALVAESKDHTPSLGVRLLADLRTVFGDSDVMSTAAILKALHALDEAPWATLVKGEPLNALGLAQRLRPYGVKSKTVRIGTETPKGYKRADLADAWARYLPLPPTESATAATSATLRADGMPETEASPRQTGFVDDAADVAGVAGVAGSWEDGNALGLDTADCGLPPLARPATGGTVCVECGIELPADWGGRYCARHGGGGQALPATCQFPTTCGKLGTCPGHWCTEGASR